MCKVTQWLSDKLSEMLELLFATKNKARMCDRHSDWPRHVRYRVAFATKIPRRKFPGGENALKWNKKLPLKLLILIKTYFYVDKLLINKVYLALNRLDWFNYLKPVRREKNSNQQFIFLLVNVRKSL